MAIADTDIKWYGSALMPEDDTTEDGGGAIDATTKIEFTDITPAGLVEMVSSEAGDTTQTVTIYGRNSAGELISQAKTLNGVTPVDFTLTWERILKAVMSATATGTVTIRKDGDAGNLITMEPGITEVRRLHYAAFAEESGGAERNYYEKIFAKNTHGTLTLTSAVVSEYADPSVVEAFAVESSLDGTDVNTGQTRLQAPSGYTFNSSSKDVANSGNLTAGSAQGIWMRLTLAAGTAPAKTTVTMRVTGQTT